MNGRNMRTLFASVVLLIPFSLFAREWNESRPIIPAPRIIEAIPPDPQTHTFPALDTTNMFTGPNTFTGTLTAGSINGLCAVDGVKYATLSAATTACPTGTVEVTPGFAVPALTASVTFAGTFRFDAGSTPIRLGNFNLTLNGPIQAPAVQIFNYSGTGVVIISGSAPATVEASWFPGANMGVQINNAAAAFTTVPSGFNFASATIHVPAGQYSVPLGTIKPQNDVVKRGDGQHATFILCTGGSGICVLFNVGTAGGTYGEPGMGLQDLALVGPGWPSGSGQAGIGVQVGDSTHADIGVILRPTVLIAGFSTGIAWANPSAWGTKLDHTYFVLNSQSVLYNPNNGGGTENIEFDHPIFAPTFSSVVACDVQVGPGNTTTDLWLNNPSFDNSQLCIQNSSKIGMTKPHFEYGNNTTLTFASVSGGAFVTMIGPVVQYDPSSGSVPAQAFNCNGATLDIYSPAFNSNVNISGGYLNATNCATRVYSVAQLTNVAGPTYSGGWHIECGNSSQGCNFGLGSGAFTVAASSGIDLQSSVGFGASNVLLFSTPAPSISSGFGTSPSVPNNNGSASFTVNVGTGGTATSGVIAFNSTAAHGWDVNCKDITTTNSTAFMTKQTATTTTTATVGNFNTSGAAAAWAASDILSCSATAY